MALLFLAACGESEPPANAPHGTIRDVVVVMKGTDEPLPFDPRGGRLTVVTQEIARLVGHPVILELDTALSPELRASLEETVLASFETFARELVLLQKEDPEMFAKARRIERIVCAYDVLKKASEGALHEDGRVLVVRSPPDRFPLLERWVVTSAVYDAFVSDLEARWGEADPARLSAREQAPWFAYMTKTRPGYGYLWIAARSKRSSSEALRADHLERIVKLAQVVEQKSDLARKVRRFLLESAQIGWASRAYLGWLEQNVASFDDEERLLLERPVFDRSRGGSRLVGFDAFAFGLSIYDGWAKDGARVELPAGPRGELQKRVVCPVARRPVDEPDGDREIRYGCSPFFAQALEDSSERSRLASTIQQRRDPKLLEMALLNVGSQQGEQALALVEAIAQDETLFHHGAKVLFHDLARRDDVKRALEAIAPRWWRDRPDRRGLALLIMARQWEHLHVHYGDNQANRFVAEFGGPVSREVLAAYLAEGARAVEMTPKIWPALAKGTARDELVAKSLPVLLAQDRVARSSRTVPVLALLRTRLCDEKNAGGMATIRAALDRWRTDHPDDGASVSNALGDFNLARCPTRGSRD